MSKNTKKIRFSDTALFSLKKKDKEYEIGDQIIELLSIRVYPSGYMAFVLRYTNQFGKRKRYKIGSFPTMRVDEAHQKARELLNRIENGEDPAEEKKRVRIEGMTVRQLCDDYMRYGATNKAESTLEIDEGRILRHIEPLLGDFMLTELTRRHIQQFIIDVEKVRIITIQDPNQRGRREVKIGGKAAARSCLALLSRMLSFAVEQEYITANPALGVKRPTNNKRSRTLSKTEFASLGSELRNEEYSFHACCILRLLLLTGCRRNEIASLQWKFINYEQQCLELPKTKTGKRNVPIGKVAIEFIKTLPQFNSEYLFPNNKRTGYYTGTKKIWSRMCKNMGLENCHMHDFRHTWASIAAGELKYSTEIIAKILGHSVGYGGTTSGYIHVEDYLIEAADKVSKTINNYLNAEKF